MELMGKSKEEFFRGFLELPHGIPSADTFRRLFAALEPKGFHEAFVGWLSTLHKLAGKQVIVDGKVLRRSFDTSQGQSAISIVSAYVREEHCVFAQLKVDEKSNEITAIPELLKMLDIKDAIVSIDAMGTQSAIASQVTAQGGDYVLALKGNQERACTRKGGHWVS